MMILKNLLRYEASSLIKNLFNYKFTAFYQFISIKNTSQIISSSEEQIAPQNYKAAQKSTETGLILWELPYSWADNNLITEVK